MSRVHCMVEGKSLDAPVGSQTGREDNGVDLEWH